MSTHYNTRVHVGRFFAFIAYVAPKMKKKLKNRDPVRELYKVILEKRTQFGAYEANFDRFRDHFLS